MKIQYLLWRRTRTPNYIAEPIISQEKKGERAIRQMKNRKAPGNDGITAAVLKHAGQGNVVSFLEKIVVKNLECGSCA